jgi:hypothetical protein
MTLYLFYSKVERISAIKFYFPGDFWTKNLLHIEVKARMHSSRDCIAYKELSKTLYNNIYVTIICELNKFADNAKEMLENPQSIEFSFESEKVFDTRICNLFVYQFEHNCGTPDTPLQATTNIQNSNKILVFLPIPQRKQYRLIGDNTINCISEGNWDKEPPILEPIIQCNTTDIDLNSSIYKSIQLQNLEFFNRTEVAVIDSKIMFQCNNGENSSKIQVSLCNANGKWIGDDYKCK